MVAGNPSVVACGPVVWRARWWASGPGRGVGHPVGQVVGQHRWAATMRDDGQAV